MIGAEERTGCANVHLRSVVVAEAGVATTLLLGEHVHGAQELLVALGGARMRDDHAARNVLALDTSQQEARVVAGLALVAGFLEHLNIRDLAPDGGFVLAHNLDLRVLLEHAALDAARGDGAAAGNGEDVLDGHEEGLVEVALRRRDPGVDGGEQLVNLLDANVGLAALDRAEGGAENDGGLIALEAVRGEQLAHLHLDEFQHLLVLQRVDLVDKDDQLLHADLAGEEQMLAGLRPV